MTGKYINRITDNKFKFYYAEVEILHFYIVSFRYILQEI